MTPRRITRGGRLALLAVVTLGAAATLAGCAASGGTVPASGGTVPGCGDPLRLAIIAQSVPSASYLPCIRGLAPGWDSSGFNPTQAGTSFLLNSDRSPGRPVTVRLTAACDVSGASPSPPRAPAVAHLHPARLDLAPLRRHPVRRVPRRLHKVPVRLRARFADRPGGTIQRRHRPVSQAAAAARPEAETRHRAQPMTPLTGAADHAGIRTPALPSPARGPKRPLTDVLADPRVRLATGTAALLVTAIAAHRDRVGRCEAAAFRAVNGLPGRLYPPPGPSCNWAPSAPPAAAGAAWLAGERELAGRLLAGGTSTWALSKVVSG